MTISNPSGAWFERNSVFAISIALSLTLLGGSLFAWTTLYGQFQQFFGLYGTLFRFADCIMPNPLITPCFYGAVAFLVALGWSVYLIARPDARSSIWLSRLLLFGVFFALAVLGYEAAEYYKWIDFGGVSVSCAPGVHPLATPCFTGFLFFAAGYALSFAIVILQKGASDMQGEGGI